jgi:hypothetical protein
VYLCEHAACRRPFADMERLDLELDAGAARVYLQFRVFT